MTNKTHNPTTLNNKALKTALHVLNISYRKQVGHVGSALSISDLLTVLYFSKLNILASNIESPTRDRFILSKGHAAAALYAVLYQKNIINKFIMQSFAENGGLCEHPEIKDPGIEMTTGSLGHGLGFGCGIAWGLRKKYGKKAPQVYVLISDGECGEGSVWEAALFASRERLTNLTVILDYNGWQCFGKVKDITPLEPLVDKWKSFGFAVKSINGHNIGQIFRVYQKLPFSSKKPSIIIAKTISGHGVSQIEDKLEAHYKVLNKTEYKKSRMQLERIYKKRSIR